MRERGKTSSPLHKTHSHDPLEYHDVRQMFRSRQLVWLRDGRSGKWNPRSRGETVRQERESTDRWSSARNWSPWSSKRKMKNSNGTIKSSSRQSRKATRMCTPSSLFSPFATRSCQKRKMARSSTRLNHPMKTPWYLQHAPLVSSLMYVQWMIWKNGEIELILSFE